MALSSLREMHQPIVNHDQSHSSRDTLLELAVLVAAQSSLDVLIAHTTQSSGCRVLCSSEIVSFFVLLRWAVGGSGGRHWMLLCRVFCQTKRSDCRYWRCNCLKTIFMLSMHIVPFRYNKPTNHQPFPAIHPLCPLLYHSLLNSRGHTSTNNRDPFIISIYVSITVPLYSAWTTTTRFLFSPMFPSPSPPPPKCSATHFYVENVS